MWSCVCVLLTRGRTVLRQGGRLPLSAVCAPWLRQCYLGVLPWPEVRHYLALVTCLGADYVLYFTVSVLRHLQSALSRAAGRPLPLLTVKVGTAAPAHCQGRHRCRCSLSR